MSENDRMMRRPVEQEMLRNLINKVEFQRIQSLNEDFFEEYTYLQFVAFQKKVIQEMPEHLLDLYFNIFVGTRYNKFKTLDLEACKTNKVQEVFFEENSRKLVFVTPR